MIVFRKIGIGITELLDLLRIEHMQASFKSSKTAAFTKKTHEIVAVNGSRFHTDHNLWNILQEKHRGYSVNNYFCTIPIVRHRKRTMFTAVGIHEIADVILAADINANIKFVLIHISTSFHRDLRSTGIQLPMILWHHQPRLSEYIPGRSDAIIRTACKNGWNTSRINSLRVSS